MKFNNKTLINNKKHTQVDFPLFLAINFFTMYVTNQREYIHKGSVLVAHIV